MPKSPGITIKNRNFSPTKCENTWEKDGVGLNPAYAKGFEGSRTFSNSMRYGKNYSLMKKLCKKCDKFTEKSGTNGEHCSLPVNERCQK